MSAPRGERYCRRRPLRRAVARDAADAARHRRAGPPDHTPRVAMETDTADTTGRRGGAQRLAAAHAGDVGRGDRFRFGDNWARYLRVLDDGRIALAEESLRRMLGGDDLAGVRFLDVGCGSGLFSLAARRLGATVHSLDYDPGSVECARALKRRFFDGDPAWSVEPGSVLDRTYMASLGSFDVMYSWGVLHHTGALWRACEHVALPVAPGGRLYVAIYNDQGAWSARWKRIKRLYCSGPLGRALVCSTCIPASYARNFAADVVRLRNPARRYAEYRRKRGMSAFHDMIDWLGGYPFEVAKPEEVFDFYAARGFQLRRLKTKGGSLGCNEFVFERVAAGGPAPAESGPSGQRG
jgi:2-polyprenyl-6-hydroxyphenyl methylase/3-demethylubiquinone-9 3-methyltransferase